jgi:hypothetical protein
MNNIRFATSSSSSSSSSSVVASLPPPPKLPPPPPPPPSTEDKDKDLVASSGASPRSVVVCPLWGELSTVSLFSDRRAYSNLDELMLAKQRHLQDAGVGMGTLMANTGSTRASTGTAKAPPPPPPQEHASTAKAAAANADSSSSRPGATATNVQSPRTGAKMHRKQSQWESVANLLPSGDEEDQDHPFAQSEVQGDNMMEAPIMNAQLEPLVLEDPKYIATGGDISRRRLWLYLISALVLVASVVAILVAVAPTDTGDSSNSSTTRDDGGTTTTLEEDDNRISPQAMDAYYRKIQTFLIGGATEIAILESTAPQSQAVEWLAYQDTLYLAPGSARLLQRYALVVLWYAHGGHVWNLQKAIELEQEQQHEGEIIDPAFQGGWVLMGGIGTHECTWSLVTCAAGSAASHSGSSSSNQQDEQVLLVDIDAHDMMDSEDENETGDEQKHHVTALHLSTAGVTLTGSLSSEIGLLTSLTFLDVSRNRLDGLIPSQVYDLTNLSTYSYYSYCLLLFTALLLSSNRQSSF